MFKHRFLLIEMLQQKLLLLSVDFLGQNIPNIMRWPCAMLSTVSLYLSGPIMLFDRFVNCGKMLFPIAVFYSSGIYSLHF